MVTALPLAVSLLSGGTPGLGSLTSLLGPLLGGTTPASAAAAPTGGSLVGLAAPLLSQLGAK
jgi:hypothetical protein